MISFVKMHGLGNDFVILDNRSGSLPALDWRGLAARHTGIGCDQVVVLEKSEKANVFMRIYNADGGEVESCGNASRCVAWLIAKENPVFDQEMNAEPSGVTIETSAGVLSASVLHNKLVIVDMGEPRLEWQQIPLKEKADTLHLNIIKGPLNDPVAVSMGNPHMVFFVPDARAIPLETLGRELEHHPLFPARANIGVAQVQLQGHIILRVWERGAGLTLACGTGACAALVAAHRRGLTGRKGEVELPGGSLLIEWREADNHVLMTGPVGISFQGTFDPSSWKISPMAKP